MAKLFERDLILWEEAV